MNIKIDKYEKTGKNKYRIYLNNGEIIDTYDNVILNNELLIKKEIDQTLYQKIIEETNIEEYYIMCQKYINYRIRSVKEIKNYLTNKEVNNDIIEIIINKLTNNNYLNDDYYCKCFINDKLKFTNMGSYKIKNDLKKNGITDEIINNYQYLIEEEIMNDRINKLIDKSLKNNKNKPNLRNKLYNNLIRLGYPIELVIFNLNNRF